MEEEEEEEENSLLFCCFQLTEISREGPLSARERYPDQHLRYRQGHPQHRVNLEGPKEGPALEHLRVLVCMKNSKGCSVQADLSG